MLHIGLSNGNGYSGPYQTAITAAGIVADAITTGVLNADLIKAGVIDPTKVVRTAITNAASVSGLLLTTDAMIAEIPKKETAAPAGGGGMGGMGDFE